MIDSFDHFASGATSGSAEPSTSTSTGGNIETEIISESDGAINDEPLVVICPYEIRSEFEVPNDFKTNNAKISFNETVAPVEKIILRKDGGFHYVLKVTGAIECFGGTRNRETKSTNE